MEREITLGDYGRVLWRGKWILVIAAIAAALIALVTSLVRETNYTSSSLVYMGLATTAKTGVPVSTPFTTPSTAQKALVSDEFVTAAAAASGEDPDRVRNGISVIVERIPGAAGGNQPTVATLRYSGTNKARTIAVTNAYAETVFSFVEENYQDVLAAQQRIVDRGERRIREIQATLDQLRARPTGENLAVASLFQQELATVQFSADEALLTLAKTKQIEQPRIISKAATAASSARPGERLRAIVFGAILGLLVGAIVTFIWRGSPAGRAATTP